MKRLLPDDFEKKLASALLVAIVFLMLFKVFSRHVFPGAGDGNGYLRAAGVCMAWMVSLGMARAAFLGLHLKISVSELFLPGRVVRRLDMFADLLFLAFAVFLLAVGIVVLYLVLTLREPSLDLAVYAAIPFGSALTIVRLLERLVAGGNRKEADA